ncbi:response regulator [Microcoleus sp. FACHB-672]|uniref:hybrid sensor histidine kinase/response regulator n=1 Tax=Microcoleus sp. FACHB-672 TaxID=2692825 RepID=UPI001684A33D|nr:response regulator [Microcoleus sp. FACHB-672]MBD2043445.1 response regulator [Microcoleus sp. FACHB-672]
MTKILIIEDESEIRENIRELLEAENFKAIGAENGKIGLQLAAEHLPDLILCDVMMPEIDGYAVLEALRKDPLTATIPFIFLTAFADKAQTRKGMELGADDYIPKPCTIKELLRTISTRLEKQAAIERQQAQKLEKLRSSIILSLPHELRTPLNGILAFSELLLEDFNSFEPAEVREMLEHIHLSGKRLYRLTQNFLLYAELELMATDPERVKELRSKETSFGKSIIKNAAVSHAKQVCRAEDLHLELQEVRANISSERLMKLVEELVDNAFKFSDSGTPVNLTSRIENNQFILSVTNQGRGMTAEQIAEVGAYMQFERKIYEQQGTGLGLSLSKRLAELHGGQLNIESVPNQETTVFVMLPC